ncbi:HAMP domain-containing histidine kinase [Egibacter rhizosphaerae]|uniref:histidine kinase n=1 Tax=Egibacter rhizosphaerae TaxID=1670831 RepID=A0A411YBU9_9ACTN|nr:HAMP domain-containing sensor histidine kinase [Egibacter rhizosphaerae]QBI18680.1 HAMP domain-containing histidine kinase [Egibacter rhizosphaerae]
MAASMLGESTPGRARGGRLRRFVASVRLRLIAWHVLLLVVGLAVCLIAARAVLLLRLDERIERELTQEVEELRALATGTDPETGEPFGDDAERILEVFFDRNVPQRNEQLLGYIQGTLAEHTPSPPAGVDAAAALGGRFAGLGEPSRGLVDVSGSGRVDYHAVPLLVDGTTEAVFVVVWHRDLEAREVDEVIGVAALVGLIMVVLAAVVVGNLSGRALRPVREVTGTARRITETDLTERLPVEGRDEVSELAHTFNEMLDRLEEAFEHQRQFIDDAGHELRTPITIIRGHLELLPYDEPEDHAATVALVTEELDRMHRMVEELLTLAKAGRPDFLQPEPVDLGDLTRTVHAKARGLASRHWVLEQVAEAVLVADAQRLTQAAVQLASNAAAHTSPQGTISIGSSVTDEAVRLWVRDDGPGIAEQERERLFDRFARGGDRARSGEGAGLGLAIVRAIAQAHGGTVEVAGAPGEGAAFTLVLPPATLPPTEPSVVEPSTGEPSTGEPSTGEPFTGESSTAEPQDTGR